MNMIGLLVICYLTIIAFPTVLSSEIQLTDILKDLTKEVYELKAKVDDLEAKKNESKIFLNEWQKSYTEVKIPKFKNDAKDMANIINQKFENTIENGETVKVISTGKALIKRLYTPWVNNVEKQVLGYTKRRNNIAVAILNREKNFQRRVFNPFNRTQLPSIKKLNAKLTRLEDHAIGLNRDELVKFTAKNEINLKRLVERFQETDFHQTYKKCSAGGSGIKQTRIRKVGGKNYYTQTFTGGSVAAIHNHANNKYTCGMGEFIAVINCVQFRTRHNDYRLKQPAPSKYPDNPVFIKLPEVPPAVLQKQNLAEQINEMRQWFRAFKEQNHKERDYRPFFKPVLVYLEGMWTETNPDGSIDEPFDSDRHFIDASNLLELQEKIRFTSYTGTKSALENLAHLPIRFSGFKQGTPIFSQWNYRISTHVLQFENGESLPLKDFNVKFDLAAQKQEGQSDEEYINSRSARFTLEGTDFEGNKVDEGLDYTLLDKFMEQIPGRDNYGANLTYGNGENRLYSANPEKPNTELNVGYYHRVYKKKDGNDGGNKKKFARFFNDLLWVAHTTNTKISPSLYNDPLDGGKMKKLRVSYAIPLEIIYINPLHSWNPYNIPFSNGRIPTGKGTETEPYEELVEKSYYQTPLEFFNSAFSEGDAADTAKDFVYAKTKTSNGPVKVTSSGVSIITRDIQGVGKLRMRYPILPAFVENNPNYKYMEALKEIYKIRDLNSVLVTIETAASHSSETKVHTHDFQMTDREFFDVVHRSKTLSFNTNTANGHEHSIKVKRIGRDKKNPVLMITYCDEMDVLANESYACHDNHGKVLQIVK